MISIERAMHIVENRTCVECDSSNSDWECSECDEALVLAMKGLKLLKEQQPMLIDVNQMKQLDDGTDIWMEGKDGEIYALTLKRPWIGFYFDRVENGTYRCWTARPTDEQRKSVPWANT
jgi:hypothetical protein